MRYLGNKTKLLPSIERVLAERGVRPPGVFVDVFSGSGAVARRMKELGWRVVANDHLVCAATQARAAVGLDRAPRLDGVLSRPEVRELARSLPALAPATDPEASGATRELLLVLAYLNAAPIAREGLIFRQYGAGGVAGRRFFTAEVARRIDGVRETLRTWRREGSLSPDEEPVLLAALLDACDRCANISGTYGAFLKSWQTNARGPLLLRPPVVVPGRGSRVHNRDGNELLREVEGSVLYVDPPYHRRQYAKNYHVLEVVAELANIEDEAAYEADIYGTTGLRAFHDRKSAYCQGSARKGPSPCETAFADLVAEARVEHVLVSYSEEGLLSREAFERVFAPACPDFDWGEALTEVSYKRFRSDGDSAARRYRQLAGRSRDEVREWLIYARKPLALRTSRKAPRVPAAAVRPVR